jgi:hypothetical protein
MPGHDDRIVGRQGHDDLVAPEVLLVIAPEMPGPGAVEGDDDTPHGLVPPGVVTGAARQIVGDLAHRRLRQVPGLLDLVPVDTAHRDHHQSNHDQHGNGDDAGDRQQQPAQRDALIGSEDGLVRCHGVRLQRDHCTVRAILATGGQGAGRRRT